MPKPWYKHEMKTIDDYKLEIARIQIEFINKHIISNHYLIKKYNKSVY